MINSISNSSPQAQPALDIPNVGNIQGRSIKPILQIDLNKPERLLKTWEIVICTITVIGLLILLGLYLCRKARQSQSFKESLELIPFTPNQNLVEVLPPVPLLPAPLAPVPFPTPIVIPVLPPPPPDPDAELKLKKEKILQDNPQWRTAVGDWREISLVNQVWVLQVFELREWGMKIPFFDKFSKPFVTNFDLPDLLKDKSNIQLDLASIHNLRLARRNAARGLSSALELLENLKKLNICYNGLTESPDISKNVHLEILNFSNNNLKKAPDTSANPKLKKLYLNFNELTSGPDISKNLELECLHLEKNQLTSMPDISCNPKISDVDLSRNTLALPSDLGAYKGLKTFAVRECGLTEFPIEQFTALESLSIGNNPLSTTTSKSLTEWNQANPNAKIFY